MGGNRIGTCLVDLDTFLCAVVMYMADTPFVIARYQSCLFLYLFGPAWFVTTCCFTFNTYYEECRYEREQKFRFCYFLSMKDEISISFTSSLFIPILSVIICRGLSCFGVPFSSVVVSS